MSATRSRWGIWVYTVSIMLIGSLLVLGLRLGTGENYVLPRGVIAWLGTGFSALALLSGHFSYPRVHNLKVYLIGYLTGVCGIYFFQIYERLGTGSPAPFYLLVFLNFPLLLMLPSFIKYRTTKYLTLLIVGAQALFLGLVTWRPELFPWFLVDTRLSPHSATVWGSLGWAAIVATGSRFRLKDEFHLGGLIAGTALFYAFAWVSPLIFFDYMPFERAMVSAGSVYLVAGIMIHWFSRMEHRVSYDPLLHIYNRAYCGKIISEQSSANTTPPFGVAMVDIDHFKKVNDTHGHQAGDVVLYQVAQTISREVVPEGIVCRYGGEEIAIFFPRKRTEQVRMIMEKTRVEIEQLRVHHGKKRLKVTVSCGVSSREDRTQSIEKVIESADKALYKAKKEGRNQVKTARVAINIAGKK